MIVSQDPSYMQQLPTEILIIIVRELSLLDSVEYLSLVNHRLRMICSPYLFQKLNIPFSLAGLERLCHISSSHLAAHVRTLRYEPTELIEPLVQHHDYFRNCVYTPSEYARDRRDAYWNSYGTRISYTTIQNYFSRLADEQQRILERGRDLVTFQTCLPRLVNLKTIQLHFVEGIKEPFRWFAGRVFVDWKDSFPDRFKSILHAMVGAKDNGVTIRTFQISGFYSRLLVSNSELPSLASDALSSVEDLQLIDSPSMLEFMSHVHLPCLRRFALESCWLWIPELEQFILAHAGILRVLHLQDTWIQSETIHDWGISLSLGNTKTIVEGLSKVRAGKILSQLTINQEGVDRRHNTMSKKQVDIPRNFFCLGHLREATLPFLPSSNFSAGGVFWWDIRRHARTTGYNKMFSTSLTAIAAIAALFIFKRAFHAVSNFFFFHVRPWCLVNLEYAHTSLRLFGIKLALHYRLVFPFAYFAGTAVCNTVGVHSISEAGVRAAQISMITLLLLCWTLDHEIGAFILGIELATYQFIHRIAAFVAVVEAAIHVIIAAQQTRFSASDSSQFYGLLAGCMFLSPIFLLLVKRRMYELFLRAHQGCAIFALYAIWKHVSSSQSKRWVLLLAILSAVTGGLQFIRIIYRNIPRVKFLTENCGADALRLTLSLPRPWRIRAGQRVYVSIPRAGLLYMFHPHPFTIAWWEGDGNGGMSSITLIVRARSGFTKKLLDRIESGCEGWAWIDGPYGPSRDSIFGYSPEVGDYGHILMVATGMGIVAQLPYIKELVDGQRQGQMLQVTVYNKMISPSEAPGAVGQHNLIAVYGGDVNWEDELSAVLEKQIGTLLITEHHITALIDMNTLNKGLEKSGINAATLLNAIDPPHLSLEDAVVLACLRGRDLLEAARRVLPPGQSADRYSEGLPVILRTELSESFSCVDGVSNVEIFGTLLREFSGIKSTSWRSRLPSDSDFRYVQRVVQTPELRESFMALIPFPGLWRTFTFRKLEHVVSPRCDEVMVHYLREIIRIWSLLLPGRAGEADALSVELIEGKMPKYSTQDRSDIMLLMNDGTLFPGISDVDERDRVLQVLLESPGRVPSLTLFFDDAKCFSGPSKAMRDLFSVGPKTSIYSAALHCWDGGTQAYNVQLTDSEYETVPINGIVPPDEAERAIASVSLLQLWLTAFRHFINPRTGRTRKVKNVQPLFELRGEPELAKSASRLGFTTPRNVSTAGDSVLPAFHYTFETLAGASHNDLARKTLYMSKRFLHIFGDGPRSHQSDQKIPELSVKMDSLRSSFRAGRPLKDEYINDRSFFFLRHMIFDEGEIFLYPSSFAVIRDIFCFFFGRQHLGSLLDHDASGASNKITFAEEAPEGANTPGALLPEEPQALADNTDLYTDSVENGDSIATSPIDLELHPDPEPSAQIMDGVQQSVPLAAGFEDEHSKAPVSRKVPISLHRSAIHEILPLWYQSDVTNVVVFYLFNSREYYKFFADAEMEMRLVLNDLARAHYFLIVDEEKVVSPNMSDLVTEVQRTRLLFVGAKSKPGELETKAGGISKAVLEDYISKYDVHTGKRRFESAPGDTDDGERPHSTKRRN
ncbi:hypothetical protein KXV55_002475 [Aspergillus fumigatus]|nr:hypothetical protein KXV55_002475 [Aspergillus fumigatus]